MVFGVFSSISNIYNTIYQYISFIVIIIVLVVILWLLSYLKKTGCCFVISALFEGVLGNTIGRGKKKQLENEEKYFISSHNILPAGDGSYGIIRSGSTWVNKTRAEPTIIITNGDKDLLNLMKKLKFECFEISEKEIGLDLKIINTSSNKSPN